MGRDGKFARGSTKKNGRCGGESTERVRGAPVREEVSGAREASLADVGNPRLAFKKWPQGTHERT